MINNEIHARELAASFQKIMARVEIYKDSTLERICTCNDVLRQFEVQRAGINKFFGFGICQKLLTVLIDPDEEINISTDNTIEVSFGVNNIDFIYPYPIFYVEDPERNASTGEITITAYDALYKAAEHRVSELDLAAPYTIRTFLYRCAALLGMPILIPEDDTSFDLEFETGANFSGDETIRQAMDSAAEVTQTIYFLDQDWNLTFIRLDKSGDPVYSVDKNEYADLIKGEPLRINGIYHTTELGDNVSAVTEAEGQPQYIRDNPFWELRDDVGTLLEESLARVEGLEITQFDCDWWGNYLLQIGDKISFTTRKDEVFTSYLLDDVVIFDGSLGERSTWQFDIDSAETHSNPTSIGEALNQTFARVDKVSGEITLAAQTANEAYAASSALKLSVEGITGTVSNLQSLTDDYGEKIGDLEKKSETIQTPEQIQHIFTETLQQEGVDEVVTSTGFTFNSDGLTVSKSNNPLSTQITENGMTVYNNDQEVLVANNAGVRAADLHAITYLIIGENSRLQSTPDGRTACYWIGG